MNKRSEAAYPHLASRVKFNIGGLQNEKEISCIIHGIL